MAKRRWMQSILKTAKETTVAMPWSRGPRRHLSIALRLKTTAEVKLAGA
jgi:hypothetical protein